MISQTFSTTVVLLVSFTSYAACQSTSLIVPKAHAQIGDNRLTMKFNSHFLSGQPEVYLTGQVFSDMQDNDTLYYETVQNPANGTLGWNNTLLGEFIYSPRNLSAEFDTFKFRAVNGYGVSNWATVEIQIKTHDAADGWLLVITCIALIMVCATCCGLARIVALQALLVPYRFLFLDTEREDEMEGITIKTASDYKPDWTNDDMDMEQEKLAPKDAEDDEEGKEDNDEEASEEADDEDTTANPLQGVGGFGSTPRPEGDE